VRKPGLRPGHEEPNNLFAGTDRQNQATLVSPGLSGVSRLFAGLAPPTGVPVQGRLGGCIRRVMIPEMEKVITKK